MTQTSAVDQPTKATESSAQQGAPTTVAGRCFFRWHRWSMWEKRRISTAMFSGYTVQERRCLRCGRYEQAALMVNADGS